MTETQRIVEQLRRMYRGPAWHGPALLEMLAGVTEEQARKHPGPGLHSIQELVSHMAAWLRIARERLSATSIRDHSSEEDWPSSLPPWAQTLAEVEEEERALENAILEFPPERLNEAAPATEAQTFYILLHGVVQHNAYHAGQIVLLKKLSN